MIGVELIRYANEFIILNAIISSLLVASVAFPKYKIVSRLSLISSYVFYIVFSAFRTIDYGIGGADSITYKKMFLKSNWYSYLVYISSNKEEIGFLSILWIIRRFTDSYVVPLILFHSISFFLTYYYIRRVKEENKEKRFVFFLFTFLVSSNLLYMMNILRSGFIISLSPAFFLALFDKKYVKAGLILAFMCSIHISAVILLAPYVFLAVSSSIKTSLIKLTKICIPIILIGEFVFMRFAKEYFSQKYFNVYKAEGIAYRTYLVIIAIMFLGYRFVARKENGYLFEKEIVALSFSLCCIPIQIEFTIAYRMLLLFIPILYLCMYHMFINHQTSGFLKATVNSYITWGVIFFYFIYRCFSIYYKDFVNIYPYSNDLLSFL